jgi:hypothetical protein
MDSPDPAEAAGRDTGGTSMDAAQWHQARRRLLRQFDYPLDCPGAVREGHRRLYEDTSCLLCCIPVLSAAILDRVPPPDVWAFRRAEVVPVLREARRRVQELRDALHTDLVNAHYPRDFVFRGKPYPHTLDAGLAVALQALQTATASDASDTALPGVPPHLDWTPALLNELMTELRHEVALLATPLRFRPSEYDNVLVLGLGATHVGRRALLGLRVLTDVHPAGVTAKDMGRRAKDLFDLPSEPIDLRKDLDRLSRENPLLCRLIIPPSTHRGRLAGRLGLWRLADLPGRTPVTS